MAKHKKVKSRIMPAFVHDAGATPQVELLSAEVFGGLFRGASAAPAIDQGLWDDVFDEAFSPGVAKSTADAARLHVVHSQKPTKLGKRTRVAREVSTGKARVNVKNVRTQLVQAAGNKLDDTVEIAMNLGLPNHTVGDDTAGAKAGIAQGQNVRIRLKAFDYRVLDASTQEIVNTAKETGAQVRGPIPLPNKIEKFTVLRGPKIDKKTRDQWEVCAHKRLVEIIDPSPQTFEALRKIGFPTGDNIKGRT